MCVFWSCRVCFGGVCCGGSLVGCAFVACRAGFCVLWCFFALYQELMEIAKETGSLCAPFVAGVKNPPPNILEALADELVAEWLSDFVGQLLCALVAADADESGEGGNLCTMSTPLLAAAATRSFKVLSEGIQAALEETCADEAVARLLLRFFAGASLPEGDTREELQQLVMSGEAVQGARAQMVDSGDSVLHAVVGNKGQNSWVKIVCVSGLLALGADLSQVNKLGKTAMQLAVIHDGICFNFLTRCVVAAVSVNIVDETAAGGQGGGGGGSLGGADAAVVKGLAEDVGQLKRDLKGVRQEVASLRVS